MMYNPYFQGFREPNQQQPIQNIINTQIPQNDWFMAKFLKNGEQAENQLVTLKTAFIDLQNKQLKIKDITGEIITYELIIPKDEKDKKIEELEKQIQELKGMIVNEQSNGNVYADNESTEQNGNGGKLNKTKSTTK